MSLGWEVNAIPDYNDWLSDGRREVKERIQNDEEYAEEFKEEHPYAYWNYEFTPDPPEEVARELGLD